MKKRHTKRDVRRMVGHLLLHHPTTGWLARDRNGIRVKSLDSDACCWCLWGALRAAASALKVTVRKPGIWTTAEWDNATDEQRKAYATKLSRS